MWPSNFDKPFGTYDDVSGLIPRQKEETWKLRLLICTGTDSRISFA
jgi:hypothetical protein